jgi:uncharacterized protein DUF4936
LPFSFYAYYRVARPGAAEALVRGLFAAVKRRTGVAGRLLTRRDDPATWMEIYAGVEDPSAFEQSLAAAVQVLDFGSVLESGAMRKLECFEDRCA